MPCAASPPSAFCQEKVTTSSFGQSSGCANAAEVASQIVKPGAVGGDPVGVRHPHARRRAVPGEDDVACRIDRGEIGQFAVAGACSTVASLSLSSLTTSLTQPSPKDSQASIVTGRGAEQRPQRHFDRAGVGRRHDADAIVGRDLQDFAGQIDGALELGLAGFRAVRAAEDGVVEGLRGSSRGAWRRGRTKNAAQPAARRASQSS